jgi:hypothetical protein
VEEPEIIGPSRTERFRAAERRIEAMSHVLDDLIKVPGTGRRVGLDPIVGLIPFIGDAVSALAGSYIIAEASRFQLPRVVLARMMVNLTVDLVIGVIPFVGDVFDFFSKSNAENLKLFRRYALEPEVHLAGRPAPDAVRSLGTGNAERPPVPKDRTVVRLLGLSCSDHRVNKLPAPPPPGIPPEGRRAAGPECQCPAVRSR